MWSRVTGRVIQIHLGALLAGLVMLSAASEARAQKEKKSTFEVYKDKAGAYRWRYRASNGTVMATPGQGYKARADCVNAINSIQSGVGGDKMKGEVYQDMKKEYRWRLKAANGQVVAASSDGYPRKAGAESALEAFKKGARNANVVELKAAKD